MRSAMHHFTRWHAIIAGVLWLAFTSLTFWIAVNSSAVVQAGNVSATTAATVLGPMTGAISRECQSCCLAVSAGLMWYCGTALAAAAAMQLVPLPENVWYRALRLAAWSLGLFVWFAGAIASLIHALF